MDEWVFKEKLRKFIKSWPILVLVFVGTAIIAGLLVHFFPPVQMATAELYLGIDITRVYNVETLASYAKTEPFNIDDYKNWQLSQVSAIATSEELASRSLTLLRKQDPYWESVTAFDFLMMQELDWYDVGVWRMRIQAANDQQSLLGVEVWHGVVYRELTRLLKESKDVLEYEGKMRAAESVIVGYEIREKQLLDLKELLDEELANLASMDSTQILADPGREEIWNAVSKFIMDDPVFDQIKIKFPPGGSLNSSYLKWLDQAQILIDNETTNLNHYIDQLEEYKRLLEDDYVQEIREAEGLSASLYLEDHIAEPFLESYYPDSAIGIFAGVVGLLIYIILWIMLTEVKVDKK